MQNKIAVKSLDLPKFRPTLTLDSDDLPELKNLNVGDKCTLKVTVELTRKSKGHDYDDADGANVLSGSFKVDGVQYESDNTAKRSDKLSGLKEKAAKY